MLNGIGGRTIAEAKANLSYSEAQTWKAYRESCGSFNIGTRVEQGFALLATCIVKGNGGKVEISDFIPERSGRESPPEPKLATVEDLFNLLNSVKT